MKKITLPKSKHKYGYTRKEVLSILRPLKIHHKRFWSAFGVNTCSLDPIANEVLYYGCDIELAIRCCLENRDKTIYEWD